MSNAVSLPISLSQALETLSRLQNAAPPQTAAKLGQIAALLQSLADENSYLNTLVLEGVPNRYEEQSYSAEPSEDHSGIIGDIPEWFTGLNDALRPPLIAIRGRADLVQGGLLGRITPEQGQWLEAIHENTDRAFRVMDSVQELISLQKDEMRIEKVNFISTDLLKEAWEQIRDKARELGHDVTIQAPDAAPLAYGDFYQSLIILTDLLDNALHYTPQGGQIRLSVDDLGTHVLFSVADNGIGLLPEEMDRVGRPFWRGGSRIIHEHNGSGMRLYLAKQVLERLDGELIFSGEPNIGSTFSFTLPVPE